MARQSSSAQVKSYPLAHATQEISSNNTLNKVICLASNENPRGPSSQVFGVLAKETVLSNRYPDDEALILKSKLAELHAVNKNNILIGSGSSELLELIIKSMLNQKNATALLTQYSFLLYRVLCSQYNIPYTVIPDKNFHQDLGFIKDKINANTKIIFLANPNNPTGTYITFSNLKAFITSVPNDVMIIIDEAYFEYVTQKNYQSAISLIREYPNIIILRTFSKVYGLAGLRIGYAIASEELVNKLDKIRRPFNVSRLGLVSAVAALEDRDYLEESIEQNACVKRKLEQGLTELGFAFIPTATNFVTVNFRDKKSIVFNKMLNKGIVLRDLTPYGLKNYLRITVGQCKENHEFLQVLSELSHDF